jgi:hypothetical protein
VLPIGGSGPPSIPAGDGKKHLQQIEPFRLVNLDAAAFDWLWRIVEQRARQHQQEAKERGGIHELQAQVSLHAALAFREAAGTLTNDKPVTKVLRRRVVKKT